MFLGSKSSLPQLNVPGSRRGVATRQSQAQKKQKNSISQAARANSSMGLSHPTNFDSGGGVYFENQARGLSGNIQSLYPQTNTSAGGLSRVYGDSSAKNDSQQYFYSKQIGQLLFAGNPTMLIQRNNECKEDNKERLKDVRNLEDLVNFKVRTLADHLQEDQREILAREGIDQMQSVSSINALKKICDPLLANRHYPQLLSKKKGRHSIEKVLSRMEDQAYKYEIPDTMKIPGKTYNMLPEITGTPTLQDQNAKSHSQVSEEDREERHLIKPVPIEQEEKLYERSRQDFQSKQEELKESSRVLREEHNQKLATQEEDLKRVSEKQYADPVKLLKSYFNDRNKLNENSKLTAIKKPSKRQSNFEQTERERVESRVKEFRREGRYWGMDTNFVIAKYKKLKQAGILDKIDKEIAEREVQSEMLNRYNQFQNLQQLSQQLVGQEQLNQQHQKLISEYMQASDMDIFVQADPADLDQNENIEEEETERKEPTTRHQQSLIQHESSEFLAAAAKSNIDDMRQELKNIFGSQELSASEMTHQLNNQVDDPSLSQVKIPQNEGSVSIIQSRVGLREVLNEPPKQELVPENNEYLDLPLPRGSIQQISSISSNQQPWRSQEDLVQDKFGKILNENFEMPPPDESNDNGQSVSMKPSNGGDGSTLKYSKLSKYQSVKSGAAHYITYTIEQIELAKKLKNLEMKHSKSVKRGVSQDHKSQAALEQAKNKRKLDKLKKEQNETAKIGGFKINLRGSLPQIKNELEKKKFFHDLQDKGLKEHATLPQFEIAGGESFGSPGDIYFLYPENNYIQNMQQMPSLQIQNVPESVIKSFTEDLVKQSEGNETQTATSAAQNFKASVGVGGVTLLSSSKEETRQGKTFIEMGSLGYNPVIQDPQGTSFTQQNNNSTTDNLQGSSTEVQAGAQNEQIKIEGKNIKEGPGLNSDVNHLQNGVSERARGEAEILQRTESPSTVRRPLPSDSQMSKPTSMAALDQIKANGYGLLSNIRPQDELKQKSSRQSSNNQQSIRTQDIQSKVEMYHESFKVQGISAIKQSSGARVQIYSNQIGSKQQNTEMSSVAKNLSQIDSVLNKSDMASLRRGNEEGSLMQNSESQFNSSQRQQPQRGSKMHLSNTPNAQSLANTMHLKDYKGPDSSGSRIFDNKKDSRTSRQLGTGVVEKSNSQINKKPNSTIEESQLVQQASQPQTRIQNIPASANSPSLRTALVNHNHTPKETDYVDTHQQEKEEEGFQANENTLQTFDQNAHTNATLQSTHMNFVNINRSPDLDVVDERGQELNKLTEEQKKALEQISSLQELQKQVLENNTSSHTSSGMVPNALQQLSNIHIVNSKKVVDPPREQERESKLRSQSENRKKAGVQKDMSLLTNEIYDQLISEHLIRRGCWIPGRFKKFPRFTIFTQKDEMDDKNHLINQFISLNPQVLALLAASDINNYNQINAVLEEQAITSRSNFVKIKTNNRKTVSVEAELKKDNSRNKLEQYKQIKSTKEIDQHNKEGVPNLRLPDSKLKSLDPIGTRIEQTRKSADEGPWQSYPLSGIGNNANSVQISPHGTDNPLRTSQHSAQNMNNDIVESLHTKEEIIDSNTLAGSQIKQFDPFDKVLLTKGIDNQILTSFRTLSKQNNMISNTLKVVHQRFQPQELSKGVLAKMPRGKQLYQTSLGMDEIQELDESILRRIDIALNEQNQDDPENQGQTTYQGQPFQIDTQHLQDQSHTARLNVAVIPTSQHPEQDKKEKVFIAQQHSLGIDQLQAHVSENTEGDLLQIKKVEPKAGPAHTAAAPSKIYLTNDFMDKSRQCSKNERFSSELGQSNASIQSNNVSKRLYADHKLQVGKSEVIQKKTEQEESKNILPIGVVLGSDQKTNIAAKSTDRVNRQNLETSQDQLPGDFGESRGMNFQNNTHEQTKELLKSKQDDKAADQNLSDLEKQKMRITPDSPSSMHKVRKGETPHKEGRADNLVPWSKHNSQSKVSKMSVDMGHQPSHSGVYNLTNASINYDRAKESGAPPSTQFQENSVYQKSNITHQIQEEQKPQKNEGDIFSINITQVTNNDEPNLGSGRAGRLPLPQNDHVKRIGTSSNTTKGKQLFLGPAGFNQKIGVKSKGCSQQNWTKKGKQPQLAEYSGSVSQGKKGNEIKKVIDEIYHSQKNYQRKKVNHKNNFYFKPLGDYQ